MGDDAPTDHRAPRGPLDGLIVADFSRVLAGPYATMMLADMGATVIKVESPVGDETRSWTPPEWNGEASYYLSINRNKQSIVLDFKHPADLVTAKRIAMKAESDRGQRIETNLMSSSLSALVNQSAAALLSKSVPMRMGNEHPSIFPYGPFSTGHGQLILATGNNRQFEVFCEAAGIAEVPKDPRYDTVANRNANRESLRPIIERALSKKDCAEWVELLSARQVPCAPINTVDQGIALAESLGLRPVVQAGSDERMIPGIANPISFSETPTSYYLAPPRLGQDEVRVRAWLDETD